MRGMSKTPFLLVLPTYKLLLGVRIFSVAPSTPDGFVSFSVYKIAEAGWVWPRPSPNWRYFLFTTV